MNLLKQLKKAFIYTLAAGCASYPFLIPSLASAGFFSLSGLLGAITIEARAGEVGGNSQNIQLLTPALNLDPNPAVGGGDIALSGGTALVPQDGPSGTLSDIERELPYSTAISVYVVHDGDTLSEIAQMFNVSVNTIMWANDLKNGTIRPGEELVILPITGVRHTAEKGDTISSIAKKYKADAEEIARANDLSLGGALSVGTVVIVPDGELAAPKSSSSVGSTAPIRGADGPDIASYYAWPVNGGVVTQGLHGYNGIDIGAPTGTAIYAAAAGTVIIAREGGWNGGYGSYLVIQHDNGTQTLYAHASQIYVYAGQHVAQGAVVAAVGATGKATGPHLHFEVRGAANPFR